MLNHVNTQPTSPKRVVILGAKGFVGSATVKKLMGEDIPFLAIGRDEIDLTSTSAAEKLADKLLADDALVVIAASAPCKNHSMLLENIEMMKSVCDALIKKPVQQVIYISSDAVYTDSMGKLNESSLAAPTSLHGVMHLAREQMLQSVVSKESLVILRPSLLYGANDPHNGYGPNSFYRLAIAEKEIALFGQGEEQRDHVYIDDVAEIIYLCLTYRSHGVLNITTGEVTSFADIINLLNNSLGKAIEVEYKPRNGAMPHNGYRAFDNETCKKAFSSFQYTMLADGLNKMHQVNSN
ncbi:MAG: NAD(P)-dependent oxidoreductase [Legionellaceae bacterium]|nr:NAD(P)-dependent oxidoreductase [Legionellaceae bacterium]